MKDERRHVDFLQVLGKVRLGKVLDAIEDGFMSGQNSLQPERVAQPLRDLGLWPVRAVERGAQVFEELRAVGEHPGANLVERLHRQAAGIRFRLQHPRWDRAYE